MTQGARDPVVAQRGDEGQPAPMVVGDLGVQTLTAQSPAAQRRHVGLDPGLVDEHQPARIDFGLMRLPAATLTRDRRFVLLARPQSFF